MKINISKKIQFLFLLIIVLIIFHIFEKDWEKIAAYDWDCNVLFVGLALLSLLFSHFILSICWQKCIQFAGHQCRLLLIFRAEAFSCLARYLPGGIWDHVGKVVLVSKSAGIPMGKLSISVFLNLILQSLGCLFVFVVSFITLKQYPEIPYGGCLLFFLPVFVVCIHPRILEKIFDLIPKKLKKEEEVKFTFSYKDILKSSIWFILQAVFFGLSFFLIIKSFYDISFDNMMFIIGVANVARVIGFLLIISPNGAGVRELILLTMLNNLIVSPVLIICILVFRLLTIAGDVSIFFIGKIFGMIPNGCLSLENCEHRDPEK